MQRFLHKTFFVLLCACSVNAMAQKYAGGDISLLPTYESHGVHYLDRSGNQIADPLKYWGDSAHWNAMRVRLFVDPSKASSTHQGEGVRQDLNYVTSLGKRIKDNGYAFMLDFHYSDTWTDPGQHSTPASWTSSNPTVLADSIYSYTKRCLQHLVAAGATPDFIQPGNEITNGMLWPTGHCYANEQSVDGGSFTNFANYLKAGIKACKEVCPNAKIVLHTELSNNGWGAMNIYKTLDKYDVDYDIIGLSYYPDFHGPLSTLRTVLNTLESQEPSKDIMIVETGYGAQWQLGGASYTTSQLGWDTSVAGQKQFTDDLIGELSKHQKVTGLFWWLPEDNEFWADSNSARSSWWNASLYIQNTGKPTDAMFEMQKFIGLDPTGINTIHTTTRPNSSDAYYNLQGQQVSKPRHGVYIHEGKGKMVK